MDSGFWILVGKIPGFLPGALFSLIGLVQLVQGIGQYARCLASRTWPRVRGQVCYATVVKDLLSTRRRIVDVYVYRPHLSYVYTVAGQEYHQSRRRIGDVSDWRTGRTFSTRKKAQADIADYFEAKLIDVYYNPKNPADAVLEPGNTAEARSGLFVGLVSSALGVGLLTLAVSINGCG
ncbi:MAG TPA: DUF3592 domain-containing protein [Anaerolineae bacterium]|nr:DUF3592 domain-containing protein [Anaerolineae bacterium]